jgi:DNA repair protein RecO (recombination protein O)
MLNTEGIIFRQTRFKESSLILDIYTREQGLQSFIINGVFSKKDQRLASVLQLMNIVQLVVYFNEQKNLHRIKEANLSILYKKIPFDIKRSAVGTFILEICRKSIKGVQVNEELFDFIKTSFISLDEIESTNPYMPLFFLVDLSYHLGFSPLDNFSSTHNCFDLLNGTFYPFDLHNIHLVNPEESEHLAKLFRKLPPEKYIQSIEQRRKILNHLLLFYKLHVDQFKDIKSLEVFKEIF